MDENLEMNEEEKKIREELAAEVFEGKPAPAAEPEKDEVETQDQGGTPEGQDRAANEPEKDHWEGVPAVLKEQLEGITGQLTTLGSIENRLKQAERRIGSIQNEFHNAKQAAQETKEAPTKEEMAAAAETEEAWEDLKEEYPDWAQAIEAKLAAQSADIKKHLPDVSEIRQSVSGIKDAMITDAALERRLVGFAHPGWESTVKSKEYTAWLSGQPADIQHKHYNGASADDAVFVLNKFKEFQSSKKSPEEIEAARNKRLDQSVMPGGKKKKPPKSEADLSDQEFRAKLAKEYWGE